jgi:hypothetical protein
LGKITPASRAAVAQRHYRRGICQEGPQLIEGVVFESQRHIDDAATIVEQRVIRDLFRPFAFTFGGARMLISARGL